MNKNTLTLLGLLFLLSAAFISCKKKVESVTTNELTGAWQETPTQVYIRRIRFETDGKFSAVLLGQGGITQNTLNGSYAIKGDSLIVNIRERLDRDDSGKIVRVATNYIFFEKGTFSVRDLQLTINYITYPADAPARTQAKFNRIMSID